MNRWARGSSGIHALALSGAVAQRTALIFSPTVFVAPSRSVVGDHVLASACCQARPMYRCLPATLREICETNDQLSAVSALRELQP
jgi:hypothetical protein